MDCPVCHVSSAKSLFMASNKHGRHLIDVSDQFEFFQCTACDLIFISNVLPDSDYYSKYYLSDYYDEVPKNSILKYLLDIWGRVSFAAKINAILDACRRLKTKRLNILDIGCGRGDFLASLDPQRFERFGVEINANGLALTRAKGIRAFHSLKEMASLRSSFQIITLWHVLEHMSSPLDTLSEIRQMMDDNGILVIATPNTGSLGFKMCRDQWFHLDAPRHLFLYNSRSLQTLLKKAGYEIIRTHNPFHDYPLDLFWSLCARPEKFLLYPFYPFLKLISQETIMAVCKKK